MTNKDQKQQQHFTAPEQFDQAILDARKEKAKSQYYEGHYDSVARDFKYPATELHSFTTLESLVEFVAEKALNGQSRFKGYMMRQAVGYYDIRIMKPKKQQEQELKEILDQVEADYRSELAHDLEAKRQIMINQLVAQEKLKEQRKQEEKEQKILAQAQADADAYIQSLMKGSK